AGNAQASIIKTMEREVEKGRIGRDDADRLLGRIDYKVEPLGADYMVYTQCDLIIEAIVEDLDVKQSVFRKLESVVGRDTVLATNTSSLSVASIASGCGRPERVLGLHFFNPPPLMALVEVVPWIGGDPIVASSAYALMRQWGKQPVLAS